MALFSQRIGIRPVQKAFQREKVDDDLRNCLWNATMTIWDQWVRADQWSSRPITARWVDAIVYEFWIHYFKLPADSLPDFEGRDGSYAALRKHFFEGKWWEVFDFLEFLHQAASDKGDWSNRLQALANAYLEVENSAYRMLDGKVVEITSETEVQAVEAAIEKAPRSATQHLKRALEFLSDRKTRDYRNSIKESVSAVEATCKVISGRPGTDLGVALKLLKQNTHVHPAFEQALIKLYAFSSDSGGIRHALTDDTDPPSMADAKFMLVACSAFCSFLLTKQSESGTTR